MTRHHLLGSMAIACCLWGCADERTTVDARTRHLSDLDRDGLLKEENPPDDGCLIMEEPGDPGDCPIMSYTETHSVTVDADGDVLAETWQVCTQCFDETGAAAGEPECFDEPPLPPDVYCEEYDGGDPTLACYRCTTPAGEVIDDQCLPVPRGCASDAECAPGETCVLFEDPGTGMGEPGDPDRDDPSGAGDGGGMAPLPPPPGPAGWCAPADPCRYVDGLPDDPTGVSCWACVDPWTGEELAWCDAHRCGDDRGCADPGAVCDAELGLCVFPDPCTPVDGRPDDPTGLDCYACADPATGEDWGGWCNAHLCNEDGTCANEWEICDPMKNVCVPAMPPPPPPCGDGTDPGDGGDGRDDGMKDAAGWPAGLPAGDDARKVR